MAYESWSVIAGEAPTESKWNKLGTNDADFNSRLGKIEETLVVATDGTTVTFDLSAGHRQYVSLGGNRILALSNDDGEPAFTIFLYHNGGVRTVTWWSNIDWAFDVVPTLGIGGSGSMDVIGFQKTAAGRYIGIPISQGN